jgi:XTP/dITP diphosphohydrolase
MSFGESMLKLLIATNNPGKMREIRSLLDWPELELVMPADLGLDLNVPETGSSYAENAEIKGRAFAKASGMLSLADDSGLEVDALDGLPGLHSARFIERPEATDEDRRRRLLERLKGYPPPWRAQFRCVVAVVTPRGEVELAEGLCEGEIVPYERGLNGFGYDPVFLIPQVGKTMAELSMDEKNQLSHRARAVKAAKPILKLHLAKT